MVAPALTKDRRCLPGLVRFLFFPRYFIARSLVDLTASDSAWL